MNEQNDMLRLLYENEARLAQTETKEVPRLNYGTANPTNWPNNVPFFRSDLGWWIYFDGTRWLTAHEYEMNMPAFGSPFPYAGGAPATLLITPSRTDYAYYLLGARSYTLVNTTNNGTNYWGFQLLDDNAVNLWAFDTSGQAAGAGTLQAQGVMGAVALGSFLNLNIVTKTGAPGALAACSVTVWYRLIIP